jgi:Protein of unknown function (DUF2971)
MPETEKPDEIHAGVTADCDLLYHYTSNEGLQGIIENDNIWATHIRFLNDYTEFIQAFKEEYLGALTDSFLAGLPESVDEKARQMIKVVLSKRRFPGLQKIIESNGHESFVCSFTGTTPGINAAPQSRGDPGDRLSQWRGYSRSSQGFSLGFDRELLKKQIERVGDPQKQKTKAQLLECRYDDQEIVAMFQEMGRAASARFTELTLRDKPTPSEFRTDMPNPSEKYKKDSSYFLQSFSKATADFLYPSEQRTCCAASFGVELE